VHIGVVKSELVEQLLKFIEIENDGVTPIHSGSLRRYGLFIYKRYEALPKESDLADLLKRARDGTVELFFTTVFPKPTTTTASQPIPPTPTRPRSTSLNLRNRTATLLSLKGNKHPHKIEEETIQEEPVEEQIEKLFHNDGVKRVVVWGWLTLGIELLTARVNARRTAYSILTSYSATTAPHSQTLLAYVLFLRPASTGNRFQ